MTRPWHVGVIFGVGLALVLAAMTWISLTALRLHKAEVVARQRAVLEENVRLALWRMDSAVTPLIARENARPHTEYGAGYTARQDSKRDFVDIEDVNGSVGTSLSTIRSPYVLLHFQIDPNGRLSSPEVLPAEEGRFAEHGNEKTAFAELAAARLAELQTLVSREALVAALPRAQPEPLVALQTPEPAQDEPLQSIEQQQARNNAELQARLRNVQQAVVPQREPDATPREPQETDSGVIMPVWIGDTLLLARRIRVGGGEYIQGAWLDWPAIRRWLLNEVSDLLPDAELEPASDEPGNEQARLLAALPVRLNPGSMPAVPAASSSPIQVSLLIAWACVLLGAAAVVVLLAGTISLSERRAAFVSAVTHELRTPLTTFRMYTEMLAEGMIPDELKRRSYLETLRREAERLSHLIENVLAYARLERRHVASRAEPVVLSKLLDQVQERLVERARQSGAQLVIEVDQSVQVSRVRADPAAVEQILFNLVDNACKYAVSPENPVINLRATLAGSHTLLQVRDHGPGLSEADARRLFCPFHKSARDAAHSAPGVGLGLALSRRLARSIGGDLKLDELTNDGACFVLQLRLMP